MILMASLNEIDFSNLEQIKSMAKQADIHVLDDNQPQFAILSMERYRELTDAALPSPSLSAASADSESPLPAVTPVPTEGEKIGALVRRTFQDFCLHGKLPREEVERLCRSDYSNHTFGIPPAYSMLKVYNPAQPLREQAQDERGRSRYYINPFYPYPLLFYGAKYLLCNHWVEASRAKFEKWARRWE